MQVLCAKASGWQSTRLHLAGAGIPEYLRTTQSPRTLQFPRTFQRMARFGEVVPQLLEREFSPKRSKDDQNHERDLVAPRSLGPIVLKGVPSTLLDVLSSGCGLLRISGVARSARLLNRHLCWTRGFKKALEDAQRGTPSLTLPHFSGTNWEFLPIMPARPCLMGL